MERRLGRIQARNPQANDLFEVTLPDHPPAYVKCGK
jgi:hypothetical protein